MFPSIKNTRVISKQPSLEQHLRKVERLQEQNQKALKDFISIKYYLMKYK
ncbi:hypothetical protein pb186bvf_008582 [Paramecium bursaria]